jgi:hypothetical protein
MSLIATTLLRTVAKHSRGCVDNGECDEQSTFLDSQGDIQGLCELGTVSVLHVLNFSLLLPTLLMTT